MEARTPAETLTYVAGIGLVKTLRKTPATLILAFLGGAFIAFASGASNMAGFNLLANSETYGLGRLIVGMVFGGGLMLIILAGGELFTGNCLLIVAVLERQISIKRMLQNLFLVYTGNFIGNLTIALMMFVSGLFNSSNGLLGGMTITIAVQKTSMTFLPAFILGLLCNWLVCLVVWASYAARDLVGKILIIFFIILIFAVSNFEHSVANMYFIPAGIFAKQNPQWIAMAAVSAEQLANLNWITLFTKNLIPVTLGNLIGGSLFVGYLYWVSLRKGKLASSN